MIPTQLVPKNRDQNAPDLLSKKAISAAKVLNEAYCYAKPSSFSRGLRLDIKGVSILLISGTASIDEHGNTVHAGDFSAQTLRTYRNITALLAAEGATWKDVVRTTCYLRDIERDYAEFNEIRTQFFHEQGLDPLPASTGIQAILCRPDLLVEMEAMAIFDADRPGRKSSVHRERRAGDVGSAEWIASLQESKAMTYLDFQRCGQIDVAAFRATQPYPWLVAEKLLTDEGYRLLHDHLPEPGMFEASFGRKRRYQQAAHDRYLLEYRDGVAVPEPWKEFIRELQGPAYRAFVARLLGTDRFELAFHWHYTPASCSVSPHCEAPWKLGRHVFYFNTQDEWNPEWGGQTLVLDDEGRFPPNSAPRFEDFPKQYAAPGMGNNSLLFMRGGHSWHGVKALTCPKGALRKVFLVEWRRDRPFNRLQGLFEH